MESQCSCSSDGHAESSISSMGGKVIRVGTRTKRNAVFGPPIIYLSTYLGRIDSKVLGSGQKTSYRAREVDRTAKVQLEGREAQVNAISLAECLDLPAGRLTAFDPQTGHSSKESAASLELKLTCTR